MNWKRKQREREEIILCGINHPPEIKTIRTLMVKQYGDTMIAEVKVKELFIKIALQWLDGYIYVIDKNDEIHMDLLGKYIFYLTNQIDSKKFIEKIEKLLKKNNLSLNALICKELFC